MISHRWQTKFATEKMTTAMDKQTNNPSIKRPGISIWTKMVLEMKHHRCWIAQPEGYVDNNLDCDDSLESGTAIFPMENVFVMVLIMIAMAILMSKVVPILQSGTKMRTKMVLELWIRYGRLVKFLMGTSKIWGLR